MIHTITLPLSTGTLGRARVQARHAKRTAARKAGGRRGGWSGGPVTDLPVRVPVAALCLSVAAVAAVAGVLAC